MGVWDRAPAALRGKPLHGRESWGETSLNLKAFEHWASDADGKAEAVLMWAMISDWMRI